MNLPVLDELISIGRGRENIDCPDLHKKNSFIHPNNESMTLETYCLITDARRPNWSTFLATSNSVSNISSSLLPTPHFAKAKTKSVSAQKIVSTRSMVLKGDFQNC